MRNQPTRKQLSLAYWHNLRNNQRVKNIIRQKRKPTCTAFLNLLINIGRRPWYRWCSRRVVISSSHCQKPLLFKQVRARQEEIGSHSRSAKQAASVRAYAIPRRMDLSHTSSYISWIDFLCPKPPSMRYSDSMTPKSQMRRSRSLHETMRIRFRCVCDLMNYDR